MSTVDQLHIPAGFSFSATKAGIKASGNLDLALAEAPLGASAAALFTTNLVCAAPVTLGREHLKVTRGRIRAVLVNAGNANCATGTEGIEAAKSVCRATGLSLQAAPEFIIPSSTGIIGVPLPTEKLVNAIPELMSARGAGEESVYLFARAIMTTDTRAKLASARFESRGKVVSILGVAKGSGMIHPNLATMLVYLFSDIEATPPQLRSVLKAACAASFNSISVDGDTSTNDTVMLLASGVSGCSLRESGKRFGDAVQQVCRSLANQIVSDGEGVKHVIDLIVEGASSDREARKIAETASQSLLVKTAWAGADPNWGRILAAAGRSGAKLMPERVNIYIGQQQVCRGGMAVPFDERAAHELMCSPRYEIRIKVGIGSGQAAITTCDLTAEYIHINADYST